MDGITKLRGLSSWAFVLHNMFPSQGNDFDKVFIFKMSEVGPMCSGVDLFTRMQLDGDLELEWMMFDHVKLVNGWTTMACHVYNLTYLKIKMLKWFFGKTLITSWLKTKFPISTLKDIWQIVYMPIGMLLRLCTEVEILRFQWRALRELASSIEPIL